MPAVVERLVFADRLDQIDVLLLVRFTAAASRLGELLCALGAVDVFGDVAPRVVLLAALAEELGAVGIGVFDDVIVVNLADALVVAAVASFPCRRPDGMSVFHAQLVRIAQLQTSRLWTCCSTMWSPQSQTK